MKKGFVISLSVILILSFLVLFSSYYFDVKERGENSLDYGILKAGYCIDDLESDLDSLFSLGIDVNNEVSARIEIDGNLGIDLSTGKLLEWQNFISSDYSRKQNSEIKIDLNKLSDGKGEVLFNNNLILEKSYMDSNYIWFRCLEGKDTNVTTYDIYIFAYGDYNSSLSSSWDCITNGDVYVNLNYLDIYGNSFSSFCKLRDNKEYVYTIGFTDFSGEFSVNYGTLDGNVNSLKIVNNTEMIAEIEVYAESNIWNGLEYEYDVNIDYSQGKVKKRGGLKAGG